MIPYPIVMWQKKQAELLKDEIEAVLASLADSTGLYDLVKEPLTQAGRALATESEYSRLWPLLPLLVCEAISGHYEQALPAAAARQFLIAAAEVFDDIEDSDSSESLSAKYGSAVATNIATILLILAEKAITRLKIRGIEDHIIIRVMDAINSSYTTACVGQHLDLALGLDIGLDAVSEDTYLRVIDMKSATQLECACHIGALLAVADPDLINNFSAFGHNLGMVSQIANDIHGITHGSDIMNHRITLPIIYVLAQTNSEAHHQLEHAFDKQSEAIPDPGRIRDLLFRTGAIHYATTKMEFFRQQARDILYKMEADGVSIERLKLFLE